MEIFRQQVWLDKAKSRSSRYGARDDSKVVMLKVNFKR